MPFQNIADMDSGNGETYREINNKKMHRYSLDNLVEIVAEPEYPSEYDGMRLYIIGLTRDCDGTPLYVLGSKGMDLYQTGFGLKEGVCYNFKSYSGFPEEILSIIKK